jgi:hypothetical protein
LEEEMPPENNKDLEQVLSEIRNEAVDPAVVEAAAERVQERLRHAAIRSCAEFQALIPDYRAGKLSEARVLLLKDHTRECLACRKALEGASANVIAMPVPRRVSARPWFRWAVAAGVAAVAVLAGWGIFDRVITGGGPAVVEAANGLVYRTGPNGDQALIAGAELAGEIHTARDSGAVVRLGDGSRVEMRERSALSVSRSGRDSTLHLAQGSIIVQAAKRPAGHLYVATRDCRVAVTGTVFSVNSGVKGSRVAVVEGRVQVTQGNREKVLGPGEQYASNASMSPVPLREEIAWSRNAGQHLALLKEFAGLGQSLEQVRMPDLRYSSRLAAMLPADTLIYAAIPNLGQAMAEAENILRERAAESPVLRQWWDQKMARGGIAAIDKFRAVSEYLGDEIVVAAPAGPDNRPLSPVFLAEVKKAGLKEYLQAEAQNLGAGKGMRIAETLDGLGAAARGEAVIFLRQDLVALSPDGGALRKVLEGGGFAATPFGARVAEAYKDGAGFVLAANLDKMAPKASDIQYAVLEQKTVAGRTDTHAVVAFRGARTGLASWLAKPGPIGALDFISPDAALAAGFAVKSPASLFDELLNAEARAHLAETGTELGINIRDDLMAPLGAEFAVALDGPVLPVPSWKLVVEVYDGNRLQATIRRLVDAANALAAKQNKPPVALTEETAGGRTWHRLVLPQAKKIAEVNYTFVDGYLVAAPSRALIQQALGYCASGYTLTRSAKFQELVPRDRYTDFSGMVYQNAGTALEALMETLPPEQQKALGGLSGQLAKPMLVTFYGEDDRIAMASTSSLLGLVPGGVLRMAGPMAILEGLGARGHKR